MGLGSTLLCTSAALAQDGGEKQGLTASGSARLRYERLQGQARSGLAPRDELLSSRVILGLGYNAGRVRAGVELWDSRVYDPPETSSATTSEVNTLEPVQAWIEGDVGLGQGTKATLRAGRMTLNLGSRRLVAADDYRNTTNGFTGVRALVTAPGDVRATLIYMLPQVRLPDERRRLLDNDVELDRETFDQQLWGGFVERPRTIGTAMLELGYLRFTERDRPDTASRDRALHSVVVRAIAEPKVGAFDWEAEGIYQFGTISTSTTAGAPRQSVSAWFVHLTAGYSFDARWKPRIALEYERASGDAPGGRYARFDTLFGSRRADVAPSGIYAQIGRANISTPTLRFEAEPNDRLELMASYRALWAAEASDVFSTSGVRGTDGNGFAGHQAEARVRYWVVPRTLRAELNVVTLLKRGLLRDAPNANPAGDPRYASFALIASF